MSLQEIIVYIILAFVAFVLVLYAYRRLTDKKSGCNCGSCSKGCGTCHCHDCHE